MAFRKEIYREHPFRASVARDGACYMLATQLKRAGHLMLYDPEQLVQHTYDVGGFGFVRKHVARGYDAVQFIRADREGLMKETKFLKLGILGPWAICASRLLHDFSRIVSHRRALGIPIYAVLYFYATSALIRGIELIGATMAITASRPSAHAQ